MPRVSQPLPTAGDYLVTTFADMMHAPSFRKHVWAKMQQTERRRLEALRLQALYGDAPVTSAASGGAADAASGATAAGTVDVESESTAQTSSRETSSSSAAPGSADSTAHPTSRATAVKKTPPASFSGRSSSTSRPPAPLRWFDVAGRARYSAWVALRGRMSADVSAECFCAEFLGFIKKHPHPTLLPLVEAALSTAHGLARRSRAMPPCLLVAPSACTAAAHSTGAATAPSSSSSTVMLQVRALQGDPAALALLWICRAYRLPCEFIVEPLSKALRAHTTGASTRASSTRGVRRGEAADSRPTSPPTTNPYLSYTMADACYPFTVSLMQPSGAAAGASPPTVATAVTTPEAAFVLLTDTFLADYPHWMGVPSDPVSAAALSPASRLVQRCAWLDELQHITRHVRTPILALLVHQAAQPQRLRRLSSSAAAAERRLLLRAVAAHLHTYERWTMDRVLSRRVHQAQSVLSPLLASSAVVDCLRHAYAPDAKVVSAADTYVSSCGYALCTHPFCADVFPFLRVPHAPVATLHDTVQAQWPSPERPPTGSITASYAPWALPLYLSGVPAEYNNTINRLLRREANGAIRQEQHAQPVRLFINDESEAKVGRSRSASGGSGSSETVEMTTTDSPQQQQQQPCRAGYYVISGSSITKEAAEAVEQLMLARMLSLRTDDLNPDSGVAGSTSSVSGVPFLVLGHVFALTWALCQEQVPGFPYFMLDGNPHHYGGFSFLSEDAAKKPSTHGTVRARGRFQAALSPAPANAIMTTADPGASMLPAIVEGASAVASASSQDGGVSLESRLRSGWQAVTGALAMGAARLSGVRRSEAEPTGSGGGGKQCAGAHATQILRGEEDCIGAAPSTTAGAVVATSRL
ncbi:conserved hypothetical protein [Leishmania infantum JPCM5]|uniref:Uncharacterized protein n=2 Tax=Leishmania infantum TaxID=5671 RepID=A4HXW0_LEIIN|nr:conserved hypothetical protein [Leishmania infantum JPCM5]CAC9480722.1 hypothetical_protein_-_conserved [Leishmania infantum]CAM67139.1 conserved hypothetical protein [Leishmania infantum JPCM5]SUZ41012.1 hypothetical_protein_-_conserved [Leishmania infantum]|eukprot:XP_001464901.1 conserved hypothetical protein [Leishmania infantum JPCM5]